MDRDSAKNRAMEFLNAKLPHYAGNLLIVDDYTIDTGESWVFYYQHRKWIQEHEEKCKLYGNLPVEVPKNGDASKLVSLKRNFMLKSRFGKSFT
jgi:hypothetical protein